MVPKKDKEDNMHKTKVYVIFHSSGLGHRGSWDSSDIKQKVMMNEEILT